MLSEHERALAKTDVLRLHDLVGRAMLEHTVLMDASFMRERILPHNGFVALHDEPRHLAEKLARGIDAGRVDAGFDAVEVTTGLHRHHDFLERRVPRTLSDAVDGALDLARSGADRRKAVCHGEPEIVVAVHADDGLVDVSNMFFQITDELRELRRHGIADRIGDVDSARARFDGFLDHLC